MGIASPYTRILTELWGIFSLTLLVINVAFDFLFFTPVIYLLIRPFSVTFFNTITAKLSYWACSSVLCPAFSWSGMRFYVSDMDLFLRFKERNCLILSNHGSRIDWVCAFFLGNVRPSGRVNFVMESFLKWMPLGWWCNWINCDMFVGRSFKQDRLYIEKWMNSRGGCKLPCLLYVAPEGMIVDITSKRNAMGKQYLANCQEFCVNQGYPKFEYVLTPRYKGLTVLKRHVEGFGGDIISMTMAFVRDGKLLNSKLDSPEREVPDLYSVYNGFFGSPIIVYAHAHKLTLSDNPDELKRAMMEDYLRKDKMMKYFDEHRHFPGKPFELMRVPHFRFNILWFAHTFVVVITMRVLGLQRLLNTCLLLLILSFAVFNTLGRFIFGYSIESIPFETGVKPVLHLYYEVFTNRFRKRKLGEPPGNVTEDVRKSQ